METAPGLAHVILAMPLCAAGSLRCGLGLALDLGLGPRLWALPVDATATLCSVDAASAPTLSSVDMALASALPSALPLASAIEMAPGLGFVRRHATLAMPLCAAARRRRGLALGLGLGPCPSMRPRPRPLLFWTWPLPRPCFGARHGDSHIHVVVVSKSIETVAIPVSNVSVVVADVTGG